MLILNKLNLKHLKFQHRALVVLGIVLTFSLLMFQSLEPRSLLLNDAYEFSVDGDVLYLFQNVEEVNAILNEYKQSFLVNVDVNATILSAVFLQRIETNLIKIEGNQFDSLDLLHEYLAQTETEAENVVVLKGDSVWKIAERYQIPIESIIVLNPDLNADLIFPGDEILIEAANPLIDVRIVFENTIEELVPYPVEVIRDSSLYSGERKIITQGVEGLKEVSYRITLLNGFPEQTEILREVSLSEPTQHIVRIGTRSIVMRDTGGRFGIVTGNFVSGFGYRVHPITGTRTFHNGIDITNSLGTPIYAYAAGTVTGAGWVGALGNTVTIDHGNGLVTRYAHLSSLNVAVGETVSERQHIGGMGRTGYTTGVHLHFEVIKNGVHQNPLSYLY